MEPKDFVYLHTHSHYSLLEALPKPKALVKRAKELGMGALALTDNGNMYGAVEFFKACKDAEIKPILGCDIYVAQHGMTDKRPRIDDRPYRLVLLIQNEEGYRNLSKIVTAGFLEGFYYKPRVDKAFLRAHSKGLIALTGSVGGEVPFALLNSDEQKARELIAEYQDIFGKENFYLEVIAHPDMPRQVDVNDAFRRLSKEYNVPLVATKNTFYLDPEDREGYEAQLCIQRGRTLEDFRRTSTEEVDLSFGAPEEIMELFADIPEALENTKKIADRIDFTLELGKNFLPIYPLPEGKTDNDVLRELCSTGLKERYGDPIPKEVLERFEFEFGTIVRMGFSSYFLIVQDYITWAKDNGILVGPGRGSAAGSIIAYALRITDIEPLRYGLLFERFLNPDRISMPDIDTDFADRGRGRVLQYITERYGADHVAGIITFGTMMPRAAVRDAARVLGLSFQEADEIAKAVPPPVQGRHTPLKQAVEESPDLKVMYEGNPMTRRVVDLAMKIEGNPRHASQHACGFVIGDKPLVDRVPLQAGQHEDTALVTQYSLNSAEAAGLVKMDFLGLSNLTIIEDTLEIIEAVHKVKIDMKRIPLDDKNTFELFGRGDTTGVFQLECVSGDTIISNATIKKLYEKKDKKVLEAVYVDEGKVHKTPIEGIFASGKKKVYTVIAENGWYIKTTLDHEFLTENGWKRLGEIKPGEKVLLKERAKHLIFNTCENCSVQIDGQYEGRSRFCYSCSAHYHKNPSKPFSRKRISAARLAFYTNGGHVWNKGLSKEESETLKETGRKIAKALTGRAWEQNYGPERAEKIRIERSVRMSGEKNPMFGRTPHHRKGGFREDLGHYVRSAWEADFARVMKLYDIAYEYEPETFSLTRANGDRMHYTPDFFIPSYNLYVEVKGWMRDLDAEKLELFKKQYPEKELFILNTTKFAEFALKYQKLVTWECPKIPKGFSFVAVREVRYAGEEETYDIKMRAPGNNFVANGFVVHNSDGMKRYIRELQPSQFEDIIAMVSLYRPGPMQFIESFIRRKHGIEQVVYEHPLMENAFKETYGIPVYQEQVMQVSKDMAGFTGGEADSLRKAMGKKIAELMAKMKVKFIEGSVKNGVKHEIAEKIFQKLEDFAAYGFNKSHAACYAMIAYQTAYLKAYYPECFMAALMNSDAGNIDRITIEVEECARIGLTVLPPDVNESFAGFAVVKGTKNVRWGLMAIKNVGAEIAEEIVRERKRNGVFLDLADFLGRVSSHAFNKKTLEALMKCGALDRFGNRAQLVTNLENLVQFNKQVQQERQRNQSSLFDLGGEIAQKKLELLPAEKIATSTLLAWEKELLGLYVSAHPATIFHSAFISAGIASLRDALRGEDGDPIRVAGVVGAVKQIFTKKKNEPMAFVRLEDPTASAETVVFPKTYAKIRFGLQEGAFVLLSGKVSIRTRMVGGEDGEEEKEERSLLADSMTFFTEDEVKGLVERLRAGDWPGGEEGQGSTNVSAPEEREKSGIVMAKYEITLAMPAKPPNETVARVREILKKYPGDSRVYLKVTVGTEEKKIATEYQVKPSQVLLEELQGILGKNAVFYA